MKQARIGPTATTELHVLLNVKEVAVLLGVGERHVRRLVFERRIPYIKWGRLVRFDPVEVKSWLATGRYAASNSSGS